VEVEEFFFGERKEIRTLALVHVEWVGEKGREGRY